MSPPSQAATGSSLADAGGFQTFSAARLDDDEAALELDSFYTDRDALLGVASGDDEKEGEEPAQSRVRRWTGWRKPSAIW